MEKKCCLCEKVYVEKEETKDKSACEECVLEAKDKEHRLRNSSWNKFEAKWFTSVEAVILFGLILSLAYFLIGMFTIFWGTFSEAN